VTVQEAPSPSEDDAYYYLVTAYNNAVAAYLARPQSDFARLAYETISAAVLAARKAIAEHSATDWYNAYLDANAAKDYARVDYLNSQTEQDPNGVYSFRAYAYGYFGSLYAKQAYEDEKV
jgi:hypothetical protein